MVDRTDDKVYAYATDGSYQFQVRTSTWRAGTGSARGITWDGTYFRVVEGVFPRKVYSYDASGVYQSAQDFGLTAANGSPGGITWDGTYFRVVDATDRQGLQLRFGGRVPVRSGLQP